MLVLCAVEIKVSICENLNNAAARDFLKRHAAETKVPASDRPEADALEAKRKTAKTDGDAHAKEDARQLQITEWAKRETPLPTEQFDMGLYYLTVMVLMCHLAFSFATNFYFRQFLKVIRPNFEKQLGGSRFRQKLSGPLLDEVHEEAVAIAEETLSRTTGKVTLGIDGHKDGNGRSLETITKAKLGVSVFAGCEYMLTERATGTRLAKTVSSYVLKAVASYIAVVADNTGNNVAMFTALGLIEALAHLFYLGCYVHVLDLLVEDVAKLEVFASLAKDAHFVISFIKHHPILYEEFLSNKTGLKIRSDLHLYPKTRFAYLYLMLLSLFKCYGAVRGVADSPVYQLCKEQTRKRGGEEGRKALAKFELFETIVETRTFKKKLNFAAETLMPLSCALHYVEGDTIPLSHVYPIYSEIYCYAQSLADNLELSGLLDLSDCDEIVELVKQRWFGEARKKGLKTSVHMLAFVLDPYAQAAVTTAHYPKTTLLNSSAFSDAREALRHYVREPQLRAVASQQLQLWQAARPTLPDVEEGSSSEGIAVATGNNAFSSLYLAASLQVWDLIIERVNKIAEGTITTPVDYEDGCGTALLETIARLKLCAKPTTFWLAMFNEVPTAAKEAVEAHHFFCRTAVDISSIVGHTCGVERAGKAYKLVMTAHRKSMAPQVSKKAVFVLSNYGLLHKGVDVGDGLGDFSGSLLVDEDVSKELSSMRLHKLRRHQLITDDELAVEAEEAAAGSSKAGEDEDEDKEEDGEESEEEDPSQREVKWASLPEGLSVCKKPDKLDDALIGMLIFMRWPAPHGWHLGTIKSRINASTPRLFKHFNYRLLFDDGWTNNLLTLDKYDYGPAAAYDSWVLIEKAATAMEQD